MIRLEQEQSGIGLMGTVAPAFTSLDEGLLEDSISPDDINEVLQQLETPAADAGDLNELSADEDDDRLPEDAELDLSPGVLDKASDPVRLYMREMGMVTLLTREQEVSIAKRIEWGQKRAERAITRSPIAIAELLKLGDELEAHKIGIREIVNFSDEIETEEQEDKAAEYLQRTIAGIQNIGGLYQRGLKEFGQLKVEHKLNRGKNVKKLRRLKRKLARTRLEMAREIVRLGLKEAARQRLVEAVNVWSKQLTESRKRRVLSNSRFRTIQRSWAGNALRSRKRKISADTFVTRGAGSERSKLSIMSRLPRSNVLIG